MGPAMAKNGQHTSCPLATVALQMASAVVSTWKERDLALREQAVCIDD